LRSSSISTYFLSALISSFIPVLILDI
ncbi:unnamed protein product, partial [Rotaria sordida]